MELFKRNLTSHAHPAKTGIPQELATMLSQRSDSTLKEVAAATDSHRVKRLLSLARLFGVDRQYGLPKKLIGTSSRIGRR
jgi:hypothetical protein